VEEADLTAVATMRRRLVVTLLHVWLPRPAMERITNICVVVMKLRACVRVPDVEVSVSGLQQLVRDAHRHGARRHLDAGAAGARRLDGAPDDGDAERRAPGGGDDGAWWRSSSPCGATSSVPQQGPANGSVVQSRGQGSERATRGGEGMQGGWRSPGAPAGGVGLAEEGEGGRRRHCSLALPTLPAVPVPCLFKLVLLDT
jgi:hypothetical protein